MVHTNKEQSLPLKQKQKKLKDFSEKKLEIVKGSSDVTSVCKPPSVASQRPVSAKLSD